MHKLLIPLAFIFAGAPLGAASYYVTQSGAGSANGSSVSNAWSVAQFNSSSKLAAGDTVFFSGNITTTITPASSGSSANVLTLNFSGATVAPPGFILNGATSYVTIVGGTFAGGTDGSSMFYCPSGGASHVTISGWTYTGSSSGNDTFIEATGGCNNWVIQNNTMSGICNALGGDGGHIDTWDVANNYFASQTVDTGCQADVIRVPDTTNMTIEGNWIIQQAPGQSGCCHNDAIQTFKSGAGGAVNPSNWVIRYNKIERNVPAGGSGDNSWMEIENVTGQPAMTIYSNVFVGETPDIGGGNGISIHSGVNATDTYYFYNNTIYRHQQPGNAIRLGEGDGPGKIYWENNVAAQDSACNCQMTQVTFTVVKADYNFFSSNWDSCNSGFTGPHGSCSTVPSFVSAASDNFALNANTALVNAGDSTIGAQFNQGIAVGATWPNPALVTRAAGAWDAGAYQSGGSGTQPPPPPPPTAPTPPTFSSSTWQ